MSIAYASRPRLRSRLTQGRTSSPWKPRASGGCVFAASLRYSCLHTRSHALQARSPSPFRAHATLSYRSNLRWSPRLRHHAYRQSFSAQGNSMSKLLRFFQMVAASKPTSSLSWSPHILSTWHDFGALAGGLGCFPFDDEAYPPPSHCRTPLNGIQSLIRVGRRVRPLALSALYPRSSACDAAPKCISERTSYHGV